MNNKNVYLGVASSVQAAEQDLPSGKFVCRVGKNALYNVFACAVLFTGFFIMSLIQAVGLAAVFFALLGIAAWVLLLYGLTYRCFVTNESLEELYWVLFIKRRKEVLWKDIRYRAVKRDQYGYILSLRFYNEKNKKLLSFDYGIVGVDRMARMAKRKKIEKRK